MLPLRDLNPHRRRPIITWLLVGANVFVFFVLQPASFASFSPQEGDDQVDFLYEHAVVPCEVSHWERLSPKLARECTGDPGLVGGAQPLYPRKSVLESVIASMFFHANLLHLAGNMWFLWVFGDNVEDRLGRPLYFAFYALGGIAATAGQVLSDPGSIVPVVGASGAIAAVLGAYLVFFPRAKVVTVLLPLFFLPFVVSAWVLLVFWFGSQFFTSPDSNIAWVAHVAGFGAGALGALLFGRGAARRERMSA